DYYCASWDDRLNSRLF
nr:immunoglobulin light chain junction region [Macaca mulatta]